MLRNKSTNPVANCGLYHQVSKAIRDAIKRIHDTLHRAAHPTRSCARPSVIKVTLQEATTLTCLERSVRQREVNCKKETR